MVAKAATVLDQVMGPLDRLLNPATAESIVDIKIDPLIQARIDLLANKSSAGTLADDEHAEYLEFVEAIDLLSIFQARAKKILGRPIAP